MIDIDPGLLMFYIGMAFGMVPGFFFGRASMRKDKREQEKEQ